jgi:hypothetical protein
MRCALPPPRVLTFSPARLIRRPAPSPPPLRSTSTVYLGNLPLDVTDDLDRAVSGGPGDLKISKRRTCVARRAYPPFAGAESTVHVAARRRGVRERAPRAHTC